MGRLSTRRLLAGAAIIGALALAFIWLVPSSEYLYVPNKAKPVADRVTVPGEKPHKGPGGIYYVDVTVRRATWSERLLPFLRPEGATLVSGAAVVPQGSSFEERRREGLTEMARSEQVAAAVALREAGYKVEATPTGALVEGVASDVPAATVLKSGDVIVSARGLPVRTPMGLRKVLGHAKPGEVVALGLRRAGKARDVTVRTVPSPADPKQAIIGIRVAQSARIELPVKVDIDLGDVGGPSAGLPFALDVLQELGRDVDRGHRVAATGEIALDGSVGAIGGVKQKVLGARKAGADVFLVPAGDNAEEARRYAGNLRIVPVESFQQALSVLRTLP
jgi:PDZ domain-containing protein